MTNRLGRALLVSVLLLTACTATSEPDRDTLPDAQTISTDVPVVEDPAPGRLLVLGTEGEITTMRPDGSDPVTLAEPAPDIERTQPTWSPDGSRVAWTERRSNEETYLLVAESDGGNMIEWPSPLLAVCIAWSPDGEHLALTGSLGQGDLLLAIAGPDEDIQVIDQGAPVYFDWAPDGTELLARVSGRFEYLAIDGSGRETVPATGDFRLGAHVAESVLLGTGRDVGEALALANRQGVIERELLRYAAPMAFVADETGSRVAVMSRGSPESQELSRLEETDLPNRRGASVRGHHLGRRPRRNQSDPQHFLVLEPRRPGSPLQHGRCRRWLRTSAMAHLGWCRDRVLPPVQPDRALGRDYLAYFDQFALSISLWAPDGSAFAYAGGDSLENAGIWVQKVEGGNRSAFLQERSPSGHPLPDPAIDSPHATTRRHRCHRL